MALAGLIMGYLSIVITFLILPAMLLPALSKAKSRAQEINCVNNLKQIGLAFKTWELDHDNAFPFNVSTKSGGTLELCAPAADGFENNPALHFQVLSNELFSPRVLVCVADPSKQPAADFQTLGPANVSYRLRTGSNVTGANPQQLLAICPIHGHQLFCDGSVQRGSRHR
jgi:competence protein ComGC